MATELEKTLALRVASLEDQLAAAKADRNLLAGTLRLLKRLPSYPAIHAELVEAATKGE